MSAITGSTVDESSRSKCRYNVLNLGTFGGKRSQAWSVTDKGYVAGAADVTSGNYHAFLYIQNRMHDLGTGDGRSSIGTGINADGVVVGYILAAGAAGPLNAFVYREDKMHILRGLGVENQAQANGINRRGQICGIAGRGDGAVSAVLWSNFGEVIRDLGLLPGGHMSAAQACNEKGDVAGVSAVTGAPDGHAFLFFDDRMHDLGTLGGRTSCAYSVNNHRQVVGQSQNRLGQYRSFSWSNGRMNDLGLPKGADSTSQAIAYCVNDSGWAVGALRDMANDSSRATLWHSGRVYDLNTLIPKSSRWILGRATGINADGLIVGTGQYEGNDRAFLLRPL